MFSESYSDTTILVHSATMSVRHRPSIDELILHSHVAVSYVENEGAGVGIVQQARRPEPCAGTVDHRIPNEEYVYRWTQKNFAAQGIETHKRCHLRSLVYALSNLHDLYKGSKNCKMPRKVMIYSKSSDVVKIIARHRRPGSECLRRPLDQDDRRLLEKVLRGIRRLLKMGPEISIVQTKSADPATTKAVTLSRRRGRKACAGRQKHNQKLQASSSAATGIRNEEEEMTPVSGSINIPSCRVQ